jgi:hypothetical protein
VVTKPEIVRHSWLKANVRSPTVVVLSAYVPSFVATHVPLTLSDQSGRELLFSHAALLTHADGKQTPTEAKLLKALAEHLEFSDADAARVIATAKERAKKLASPESSTGGSAGTGVGCRSRRARAIFHAIGASASALLHALGLSGHGPAHGSRRPATPWAQLCPRSALERDHGIADW